MLYLLRLSETGREAQATRRKTSRDIVAHIREHCPEARIRTEIGRVLVETRTDATAVLRHIHGVGSFSPCQRCDLDDIEEAVVRFAADTLSEAATFRIRVKRVGRHAFTSQELASRLGARVGQEFPHLAVDLHDPDAVLGVEIRGQECFLFERVIPGADRRRDARTEPNAAPDDVRFLVDQMLGPLAGWLRLLGFDSTYARDVPDCNLVRRARDEGRVILTRDRELSETPAVTAYFLHGQTLPEQLDEVAEALDLRFDPDRMFTRCSRCNQPVEPVAKQDFSHRIPRVAYELYDEFTLCRTCDKLYWKGGQYDRILGQLSHVVGRDAPS